MIAKGRVLLPTGEDIFANITMLPLDDPRKGAAALAMAYTLHALVHPRVSDLRAWKCRARCATHKKPFKLKLNAAWSLYKSDSTAKNPF